MSIPWKVELSNARGYLGRPEHALEVQAEEMSQRSAEPVSMARRRLTSPTCERA